MMLAGLKKFLWREAELPVETYGKLPCYKDFISVILTESAAQWRNWLLENFQGDFMPPKGCWHFIYQDRKKSLPIVGLIHASSDGIRQFPFTLFTVCSHKGRSGGLCSRPTAISIWRALDDLHQQLIGLEDIQAFYRWLSGQKILASMQTIDAEEANLEFLDNQEGEWPRMLVAETSEAKKLHLVKDGRTTSDEFARNWLQVSESIKV
jgi:hypothetical protein